MAFRTIPMTASPGQPGRARRGRRYQAGHHRQHDESQDIVQDRRAEDHLPLTTLESDPKSFRTRAEIPMLVAVSVAPTNRWASIGIVGQQPPRGPPPEHERDGHADGGDERGRGADPDEGPQVGLQADAEQQDQHPDLGQHVEGGLAAHEGDPMFAEEGGEQVPRADPHEQFAEDRRLAPSFRQDARRPSRPARGAPARAGPGRPGTACRPSPPTRRAGIARRRIPPATRQNRRRVGIGTRYAAG